MAKIRKFANTEKTKLTDEFKRYIVRYVRNNIDKPLDEMLNHLGSQTAIIRYVSKERDKYKADLGYSYLLAMSKIKHAEIDYRNELDSPNFGLQSIDLTQNHSRSTKADAKMIHIVNRFEEVKALQLACALVTMEFGSVMYDYTGLDSLYMLDDVLVSKSKAGAIEIFTSKHQVTKREARSVLNALCIRIAECKEIDLYNPPRLENIIKKVKEDLENEQKRTI